MTLTQIVAYMGVLGIPSIFVMTGWCIKTCIKFTKDLNFISSAIKSQIRSDLMKDYECYSKRGWCSEVEQTEWLNRYKNYHNLYGENGVLDKKKDAMEDMPNSPQ